MGTIILAVVFSTIFVSALCLLLGHSVKRGEENRLAAARAAISGTACPACQKPLGDGGFSLELRPLKSHGKIARRIPSDVYVKLICEACGGESFFDSGHRYHDELTRHRRGERSAIAD